MHIRSLAGHRQDALEYAAHHTRENAQREPILLILLQHCRTISKPSPESIIEYSKKMRLYNDHVHTLTTLIEKLRNTESNLFSQFSIFSCFNCFLREVPLSIMKEVTQFRNAVALNYDGSEFFRNINLHLTIPNNSDKLMILTYLDKSLNLYIKSRREFCEKPLAIDADINYQDKYNDDRTFSRYNN